MNKPQTQVYSVELTEDVPARVDALVKFFSRETKANVVAKIMYAGLKVYEDKMLARRAKTHNAVLLRKFGVKKSKIKKRTDPFA